MTPKPKRKPKKWRTVRVGWFAFGYKDGNGFTRLKYLKNGEHRARIQVYK